MRFPSTEAIPEYSTMIMYGSRYMTVPMSVLNEV